jgi:hypothetical protein
MANELTAPERSDLKRCEKTIEKGMATFLDVGRALLEIQQDKLYRDKHGTFEAYCKGRWEMGKSQAYRLIDAVEVDEQIKMSPIGDKMEIKNESQARELVGVSQDDLPKIVEKAVEIADGNPVTAKAIRQAKGELLPVESTEVEQKSTQVESKPDWRKIRSTIAQHLRQAQLDIDDLCRIRPYEDHQQSIEAVQTAMRIVEGWK